MIIKIRFMLGALVVCQIGFASFAGGPEIGDYQHSDTATCDVPKHRQGYVPADDDDFKVVVTTSSDSEAPIDERPGYVRRWNPDRQTHYYVKVEAETAKGGLLSHLRGWIQPWLLSTTAH